MTEHNDTVVDDTPAIDRPADEASEPAAEITASHERVRRDCRDGRAERPDGLRSHRHRR